MKARSIARVVAFSALCATAVGGAGAASPFYAGKTVIMTVGAAAGGSYDINARMLAPYLSKHIPGHPTIVVQNVVGAGGIAAINSVVNLAPKDGTVIAAAQRMNPFDPLLDNPGARYDPLKIRWLGSTAAEAGVVAVWHTAPQKTAQDVFNRELIVGATQAGADTDIYARALNNVLGTKLKIIDGYASSVPILLAIEHGEVQGIANLSWSDVLAMHPEWLSDKKLRVLISLSSARLPELPEVPTAAELAHTDAQRQVLDLLMKMKDPGRPFYMAPDVPADRYAIMETAFLDAVRDPGFVAAAAAQRRSLQLLSGDEMKDLLDHAYALPPSVVAGARAAVGGPDEH